MVHRDRRRQARPGDMFPSVDRMLLEGGSYLRGRLRRALHAAAEWQKLSHDGGELAGIGMDDSGGLTEGACLKGRSALCF